MSRRYRDTQQARSNEGEGQTAASACRLETRVARFRGVSSGCAPLASRSLSARLLRTTTGDDDRAFAYIELGPWKRSTCAQGQRASYGAGPGAGAVGGMHRTGRKGAREAARAAHLGDEDRVHLDAWRALARRRHLVVSRVHHYSTRSRRRLRRAGARAAVAPRAPAAPRVRLARPWACRSPFHRHAIPLRRASLSLRSPL